MKKNLSITVAVIALLSAPGCMSQNNLIPHLTQGNLFNTAIVPKACIIRDSTDIYWSIFSSDYFGFHEFWVAYSRDAQNWSRPLYTSIPVLPSSNFQIKITNHRLDIDWYGELTQQAKTYYRSFVDTTNLGYTVFKSTLYEDTDADGLSDLAEDRLWTNPLEMDTDKDDIADGFDQNPLAAPAEKLTLHERLHKTIIEYELEEFYSNQLIVVEQFNDKPMEYNRYGGVVLSFSPGACDAFVADTGYGVPILTCTVKDTLNRQLKASFQFFIAPDDAWGYDVLCRCCDGNDDFFDFKVYNEWVAE